MAADTHHAGHGLCAPCAAYLVWLHNDYKEKTESNVASSCNYQMNLTSPCDLQDVIDLEPGESSSEGLVPEQLANDNCNTDDNRTAEASTTRRKNNTKSSHSKEQKRVLQEVVHSQKTHFRCDRHLGPGTQHQGGRMQGSEAEYKQRDAGGEQVEPETRLQHQQGTRQLPQDGVVYGIQHRQQVQQESRGHTNQHKRVNAQMRVEHTQDRSDSNEEGIMVIAHKLRQQYLDTNENTNHHRSLNTQELFGYKQDDNQQRTSMQDVRDCQKDGSECTDWHRKLTTQEMGGQQKDSNKHNWQQRRNTQGMRGQHENADYYAKDDEYVNQHSGLGTQGGRGHYQDSRECTVQNRGVSIHTMRGYGQEDNDHHSSQHGGRNTQRSTEQQQDHTGYTNQHDRLSSQQTRGYLQDSSKYTRRYGKTSGQSSREYHQGSARQGRKWLWQAGNKAESDGWRRHQGIQRNQTVVIMNSRYRENIRETWRWDVQNNRLEKVKQAEMNKAEQHVQAKNCCWYSTTAEATRGMSL